MRVIGYYDEGDNCGQHWGIVSNVSQNQTVINAFVIDTVHYTGKPEGNYYRRAFTDVSRYSQKC